MSQLQRILYIEDEPDIQAVAALALEAVGGFNVQICSSGEEGLRTGPNYGPDLILLDVMMPGMDGPSTLQALRDVPTLRNVPVVFMTAKVQPGEVSHYLSLGACGVIAKPFDPMTLASQIQTIWDRQERSEAPDGTLRQPD